ncbi:MAG: hypothetical protein ABW352_05895 [Polyangiales bacterium]
MQELSHERRYELFRDYLKHEDELINHRLVWGLSIQAFVVAAFAVSLDRWWQLEQQPASHWKLLYELLVRSVIPGFGFVISVASTAGIYAAHRAVRHVVKRWHARPDATAYVVQQFMPGLTDGGAEPRLPWGMLASLLPSLAIGVFWLIVIAVQRAPENGPWIIGPLVVALVSVLALLLGKLSNITKSSSAPVQRQVE